MEMLASLNMLAGKISPLSDNAGNIHDNDSDDVPDDDAIKMFVGQVPRAMDEDALKQFFEDFGPVHQLNVLRDKTTGVSRGCCFVTFYKRKHALDAQNALHNIKTMTGMHHPIQMKPADTENRNERKLFIGMVCKKLTEEDIKAMFLQFGAIEECTVLRDDNGISRGCAFVTFSNRQVAIVAIKAMHHSLTMEGCSSPLVVKFADTQKEKEHKKVQQDQTNLWSLASVNSNGLNGLNPGYLQACQPQNPVGGLLGSPLTVGAPQLTSQLSQLNNNTLLSLQQLLMGQQQQQLLGAPSLSTFSQPISVGQHFLPPQDTTTASSNWNQNFANYDLAQYRALSYLQPGYLSGSLQSPLSSHPYLSLGQSTSPLTTSTTSHHLNDSLSTTNCLPYMQTQQNAISSLPTHVSSISSHQPSGASTIGSILSGGKMKTPDGSYNSSSGPDGANLFIYHLPQEFSDSDLIQTFQPFGTIVSAKVFIDKQTNLSKCFGFVSYTTNESAHAAIQAMNGFQIGTKRLKVQLKRPKDASKPY
eukprot:GFUD01015203.1.p1 GENE.GFUD01015203.1~~GFUD01015203.1.p1  ORF type:complete len:530 (-),score=125.39 GFUD01015203.1:89-1678(-)